jgi:hypothetical protein
LTTVRGRDELEGRPRDRYATISHHRKIEVSGEQKLHRYRNAAQDHVENAGEEQETIHWPFQGEIQLGEWVRRERGLFAEITLTSSCQWNSVRPRGEKTVTLYVGMTPIMETSNSVL